MRNGTGQLSDVLRDAYSDLKCKHERLKLLYKDVVEQLNKEKEASAGLREVVASLHEQIDNIEPEVVVIDKTDIRFQQIKRGMESKDRMLRMRNKELNELRSKYYSLLAKTNNNDLERTAK